MCRSVARSLSGQGPKGEPDALITAESEILNLLRRLKLIRWSDSFMIDIGVEIEYRSVSRSLFGWGSKGEPNVRSPLRARLRVYLKLLKLVWWPDSSTVANRVEPDYRFVAISLFGWGLKESPMPRSPLRARSRISWGRDTFVVVFLAFYEMLEFWIEYAYLLGMKMSCCPDRASPALLIGMNIFFSEVVVCYLSIAQRALVLEREPRFVPLVRPYGRIVLKFGLRWSATGWRRAAFYRCWPIDHWVLVRGIDRFLIATLDQTDFLGLVVRISLRLTWIIG
jgi:hypothetical protein